MFEKEVVVRCESGLHNKQATYFVQKANEFDSSIWVESGNRKMNAKSLLGMILAKNLNWDDLVLEMEHDYYNNFKKFIVE